MNIIVVDREEDTRKVLEILAQAPGNDVHAAQTGDEALAIAEGKQVDLLITEVKSALAEDGISKGYPVEVDADHGTVTLSGVVASAEDVRAAAQDAADIRGVVAVRNQLRPH